MRVEYVLEFFVFEKWISTGVNSGVTQFMHVLDILKLRIEENKF